MLDLNAEWKVGNKDCEIEGRSWVVGEGAEGCLVANVGSKEGVVDPGKGWVMRETWMPGSVMGHEGPWAEA